MSKAARNVRILGVPMDLGQKKRGVDMGPSALRYAQLTEAIHKLGCNVTDEGNVSVPIAERVIHNPDDGRAHNASAIGQVCRDVYQHMRSALSASDMAIVLGGDHTVALGSVAAALEQPGQLGVLWVDAHADFNTPLTTPSKNVHGMVVSALMGHCPPALTVGEVRLQPQQIVMIACRDLDEKEKQRLRKHQIQVFTMSHIDKAGMKETIDEARSILSGATSLHVSFDLDSLDPSIAPGVGTPVSGGLSYREAHLLMEMLADDKRVHSLDLVEVNPILDVSNKTAEMAVELTASLLGKRIL